MKGVMTDELHNEKLYWKRVHMSKSCIRICMHVYAIRHVSNI